MAEMIDSVDYLADNVVVAPVSEWRIMRAGIAKVSKNVPRYCPPNCQDFKMDSDKSCIRMYECNSFVFDTHRVERGDKVVDVLFSSNALNMHEGWSWVVGEKYLISLLGEKRVKRMLKQFETLKQESDEQGFTIPTEGD